MTAKHGERKHSKFSASGAERWMSCSGSVALSEGMPDKDTPWSLEGTEAHEILESIMRAAIRNGSMRVERVAIGHREGFTTTQVKDMVSFGTRTANFILALHAKLPASELLVETRIHLTFIHPEMFGTFDGAVIDHFGTLHVFDYKYGSGHAVSPKENLQMIFYGLGLAHEHHWNFKRVRLWIDQPRIKGYDGPAFWEMTITDLKKYVPQFERAVENVLKHPNKYAEGSWCYWCKAKQKCPLKRDAKIEKAKSIFKAWEEVTR